MTILSNLAEMTSLTRVVDNILMQFVASISQPKYRNLPFLHFNIDLRFHSMASWYFRDANGLVLVYDITHLRSFERVSTLNYCSLFGGSPTPKTHKTQTQNCMVRLGLWVCTINLQKGQITQITQSTLKNPKTQNGASVVGLGFWG